MECCRDAILLGWAHAVLFSGRRWWAAATREGRFSWDNFFVGTDMGCRDGFGSVNWDTGGDKRALECFSLFGVSGGIEK